MAKDKHSCLVFVQVHIKDKWSLRKRLVMTKTTNQMSLIVKMYRSKIAQKNLNIHVMFHH